MSRYIRTSDTTALLDAALAQAQGAIETPQRSGKGLAGGRGNQRSYSYSTITDVLEALRKPCADAQVSHTKTYHINREAGWLHCTLRVAHAGEWMEFDLGCSLQRKAGDRQFVDLSPQAIGSSVTYLHRYLLMSVFGVAGEDDDAAAVQPQQRGQGGGGGNRPADPRRRLFGQIRGELRRLKCEGRDNQDFFIAGLAGQLGAVPDRLSEQQLGKVLGELKSFTPDQARDVFRQLQRTAAEGGAS